MNSRRVACMQRQTNETQISVELNLDGDGRAQITTGLGFLDHMLTAFSLHGRLDLRLTCTGDLHVDDHHSVEDCAIVLGSAIDRALNGCQGIARFGWAYAPMDEALARAVVDLSGRTWASVNLELRGLTIGSVACENIAHFFVSLACAMRAAVHVDVLRGANDHHRAEAAFKAFALALRQAVAIDASAAMSSTKGEIQCSAMSL